MICGDQVIAYLKLGQNQKTQGIYDHTKYRLFMRDILPSHPGGLENTDQTL